MKLTCKLDDFGEQVVEVKTTDHLSILLDLLVFPSSDDTINKLIKFTHKGRTYPIYSELTFQEIGIIGDTSLFIISKPIAGEYN